jgi:hypothetical protein
MLSGTLFQPKSAVRVPGLRRGITTVAIVGGVLLSSPGAFASTFHASTTYKPGEFCAKAKLGKTTRDGKLTLVCKKVGKYDRWETR